MAFERPHLHLVRETDAGPARKLARAADEQVRKARDLMHAGLAERWTVTSLARKVGLSRPAFARRFVASTGQSPLKYLTQVRMEQAARLLGDTDWGLARIAAQVGYDSEHAFNRAFKRVHRVAPGTFRRSLSVTMRAA
jgi:transcriptional regulator GlxA family with amidase domain